MTEKGIHKVPEERSLRDTLRKETALFVRQHGIQPPPRMEILEIQSQQLLQRLSLDRHYLHFVMVLMGNEIWRSTLAAIPLERRLLLLPQCLRNHSECKGQFDDLGLLCAGCKNCQLDHILERAEKMGYATLIAEGTTAAIGLVEEGSVDAVIGVSCLPVLQKSFEPVTRAAVPAIGLPLLYDGCENTSMDYGWLFAEMEQYSENPLIRPVSVSLLKNQVHSYFNSGKLEGFFKGSSETERLAQKVMALGGQRMRPLLALLSFQSYSGSPSEQIQAVLAIIVECFHKASLLHDDIQDNEDFRYDQPALHKTEGIAMAINVGDYLIGKGYQLLSHIPCDPEVRAKCLKVIADSHVKLSEGQGADIRLSVHMADMTVEGMLAVFAKKTGEAVKVALLMGAIAGKAPDTDLEHLSHFSENFGIAYQIRDDLNEFREANENKHAFDFPFLLALLREDVTAEGGDFSALLASEGLTELNKQIALHQTEEKAEILLQKYLGFCYNGLDLLQNTKLRLGLYAVMGKVFTF